MHEIRIEYGSTFYYYLLSFHYVVCSKYVCIMLRCARIYITMGIVHMHIYSHDEVKQSCKQSTVKRTT